MKSLDKIYLPAEVESFIDEIGRDMPGLRTRAESKIWTPEELAGDMKLEAMCKALARLKELKGEIASGIRANTGDLLIDRV